jgi:hypothetical protein
VPLFSDRKPFYVLRTSANEMLAQFSPDGRFVAYQSDESGRFEIYVQTFPPSASKWQISRGGGAHARWRRDGKELYFIGPEEKLMAVDVKIEGGRLSSGTPVPLFDIHPAMSSGPVTAYVQYDVMPDGGRFVVATLSAPQPRPLTVVLNLDGDAEEMKVSRRSTHSPPCHPYGGWQWRQDEGQVVRRQCVKMLATGD